MMVQEPTIEEQVAELCAELERLRDYAVFVRRFDRSELRQTEEEIGEIEARIDRIMQIFKGKGQAKDSGLAI